MTLPAIAPQPGIMEIALYQGGAAKVAGIENVVKLSSNENPHAPVSAVLERIHEVVTGAPGAASPVCRYPDPLSTALRERLAALEVGRVETVRAFEQDAPPAKLAFYSLPQAAIANTHQTLPRLSQLLRLQDSGLKALKAFLDKMSQPEGVDY